MAGRMLFIQNLGLSEWLIILVVVLVLFGGKKIPQLAKDLGSGIREFRRSISGNPEQITGETEKREDESTVTSSPNKPASKKARRS